MIKDSNKMPVAPLPNGPYLVLCPDMAAMWSAMGGLILLALEKGIAVNLLAMPKGPDAGTPGGIAQFLIRQYGSCKLMALSPLKSSQSPREAHGRAVMEAAETVACSTLFLPEKWVDKASGEEVHGLGVHEVLIRGGLTGDLFQYGLSPKSPWNRQVDIRPVFRLKSRIQSGDFGRLARESSDETCREKPEPGDNVKMEGFWADILPARPHEAGMETPARPQTWDAARVLILDDQSLVKRLNRAQANALRLTGDLQAASRETAAIVGSLSWRMTRPVRVIKQIITGKSDPSDFLFLRGLIFLRANGVRAFIQKLRFRRSLGRDFEQISRHLPKPVFLLQDLKETPLISILVPVYNPPPEFLSACLDSVLAQTYPHWELCITDDASTDPDIRPLLEKYKGKAKDKIHLCFHEKNQHICAATNSCLKMASGKFVALLDHDDLLTPDALMTVAHWINRHPDADMIYSDEDKVDDRGKRCEPFFKPDWSPEMLKGQMYTCHLGVYRASRVKEAGGFRPGFEGAQDHDLALRICAKTNKIHHIPHILYHWRKSDASCSENPKSKSYAYKAGLAAVNQALDDEGEGGWAEPVTDSPGSFLVHYPPKKGTYATILIPTKDQGRYLERCLSSVFRFAGSDNWEVRIIDNGSKEAETFEVFDRWDRILGGRFCVQRLDAPFNFSMLNNQGAKHANGDFLLLLNNDTEALVPGWLGEMTGYAARKDMGAVGAFLLYPDNTLQHAGVVLGLTGTPGMKGVAGHSHKYFPAKSKGYFSRLRIVSNYSAVTGACLMVKTQAYKDVGGMNEALGVAFNDVDFCLKLIDKGYRNVVLPHVSFIHHESKSRGFEDNPEKQKRFAREIRIMLDTWGDRLENDPCYNPNLTLWREDFNIKCEKEFASCALQN